MDLNKNLITRWVEALRSGKYTQGKGHLHVDDKFCCLGILCDLAAKDNILKDDNGGGWHAYGVDKNVAELPKELWADVGMTIEMHTDLITMNDQEQPKSFNEIADYIEANLG